MSFLYNFVSVRGVDDAAVSCLVRRRPYGVYRLREETRISVHIKINQTVCR